MTTLDATADNVPGRHTDHEHDREPEPEPDRQGSDHDEHDAVRHWLTARLSDAPPLTSEQLQRLRLLLGVEQVAGRKSA
jgi:hypothetical protein